MKKNEKKGFGTNNSSAEIIATETVAREKGKVSVNPDSLSDTALSIDNEESESPKKKATFDKVREMFGFSTFDGNNDDTRTLAADFASGKLTFEEFNKKVSESRKNINSLNSDLDNIAFDDICSKIQESELIGDFSLFVGTNNLLSLKDKLLDGDKVVLFHGKQSDDSTKPFAAFKVTLKGLHRPYSDTCYYSLVEYSTTNVIRAFRNYGYYLNSLKRCKRQRKQEADLVALFKNCKERLHEDFGYMAEDFANL